MLYFYNVCTAFVLQGRPETMRWTIFFPIFSTSKTDDNGNRNLYFLMEASRPPLHRPWFNRIFRPDCTTASTLKLPQWHAHILPIYNVYALVLVNLCTLFFSHSLANSLSHSASHGPFVRMGVRSETTRSVYLRPYDKCVGTYIIYTLYIYIYRRPYTTHADKRHTYNSIIYIIIIPPNLKCRRQTDFICQVLGEKLVSKCIKCA